MPRRSTYSVCPQTLTISLSEGFLYLVVLHRGQPWSSIPAQRQARCPLFGGSLPSARCVPPKTTPGRILNCKHKRSGRGINTTSLLQRTLLPISLGAFGVGRGGMKRNHAPFKPVRACSGVSLMTLRSPGERASDRRLLQSEARFCIGGYVPRSPPH